MIFKRPPSGAESCQRTWTIPRTALIFRLIRIALTPADSASQARRVVAIAKVRGVHHRYDVWPP